ncbi:MAG TPA: peptidoglycan DD-metalloendopeptidase family protein [Chthoniobacterales bacterium]|nr:peptidoglycan DD-metalloendopeptidase family protein [Chthoniobacterales bacterium]
MNNCLLGGREFDITDWLMVGKVVIGMVAGGWISIATGFAQTVEIPREKAPTVVIVPKSAGAQPQIELRPKIQTVSYTPAEVPTTPTLTIEQMRRAGAQAGQRMREELHDIEEDEPPAKPAPVVAAKKPAAPPVNAVRVVEKPPREAENFPAPPPFTGQTAFVRLADGFDMPVGKPDAHGYYRARGFRSHGHMGEDWDGVGGGDTDLGDPVSVIADGVVVFARDCHQGWGNVIIVRHAYRDGLGTRYIDSLYGHLDKIMVKRGQGVKRGQQIATIGNAHGLYDAHLHLEIRKNLEIGMSRDKFAQDSSNYYDPSQFITSHRHIQSSGASCRVAMNTFTYDSRIHWDKLKNYSGRRTGGGQSESAYALKKALASPSSHRD